MAPGSHSATLAQRRQALVARSQAQRARLVRDLGAFAPAFRLADGLFVAAGWLSRNGVIILGVAAMVVAVRKPARLVHYAGRAWSVWQLYRGYRSRFDGFLDRVERRV